MTQAVIDKNRPSPEWIAELRRRFPCETEIDRVLSRKLERRAGPPYAPVTLAQLEAGTQALLKTRLATPFTVRDCRWLSGGASKLQMAFTLDWTPPGGAPTTTPLVLRMEPSEAITETSRLREFQIIKALEGVVPVPPTYWIDAYGEHLPYPAIVYGFANGVTKPTASSSGVSGVGTFMPPEIRETLGQQFVDHLAATHRFDWQRADLSAYDRPAPGTQALEWALNHWERVWEEDAHQDVPLMRLTMAWLRRHMPPVDRISVVHGDYRLGNFLYTEADLQISAWLDWELAYLGDRHEDLSWCAKRPFGHLAEDGKTFLVGGFLSMADFVARYEKASGLKVDPLRMRYYDIFNNYKAVAIVLSTGYRAPRNGKTHQDVLVAWITGIAYSLLEELRTQMAEVL
jgi:aminoglycoside phosphotransferase (APT) family kinase protein